MTTTGTYAFLPTIAELISEAFERCGKDPKDLSAAHIDSAIRSMNLQLVEMENEGGDLMYRRDRCQQTLTLADRGFVLPAGTLAVIEAVCVRNAGASNEIRRIMSPISQREWDQVKQSQSGMPLQYFVQRALPTEASVIDTAVTAGPAAAWGPNSTLGGYATDRLVFVMWPAADTTGDVIIYTRVRQAQDADQIADTADVTRQWYEALVAGLAKRLSIKWAPDRLSLLVNEYDRELMVARQASRNREPITIGYRGIGHAARRRRL